MTVHVKITNDGKKIFTVDVGDLSTEAAIEYIEGIKKRNIGKESLTMKHDISEPGKGGLSVRSEYNFEKALKIFNKVDAVINDKFISVSISQSVIKSSLNSGAINNIFNILKSLFNAKF